MPSDQSNVKAVVSGSGKLLYASRSVIPFSKTSNDEVFLQICGMYFFSKEFLINYPKFRASVLEELEQVEQLRCLENDSEIYTFEIEGTMFSIDTGEDLNRARQINFERYGLDNEV